VAAGWGRLQLLLQCILIPLLIPGEHLQQQSATHSAHAKGDIVCQAASSQHVHICWGLMHMKVSCWAWYTPFRCIVVEALVHTAGLQPATEVLQGATYQQPTWQPVSSCPCGAARQVGHSARLTGPSAVSWA
jgi:hypothetical protein